MKKQETEKEAWDRRARRHPKYYICSSYGKGITEKEFRISGFDDCEKYIANDSLICPYSQSLKLTFLELGCGTGRMTEFLSMLYKNIIGIDISGEMIKEAKQRLKELNPHRFYRFRLIETNGYTFPLEDNSVDFAFSYIVFQHFKTMEMVESNFKEAYRVLKPRGLMKVRVRTDKAPLNKWWGGVSCDESYPLSLGFKLIKKEPVEHYGLWLWLEKPLVDKKPI